ncbi:MAG TPA: hypothetical protein VK387_03620 [Thermoleophilaceae bacterium]|nr:hypothetical protein [Thermoleophilaceae bacterium]
MAGDRFLERNQALRLAVGEVQHLRTLLAYLSSVAQSVGAAERAGFCRRWEAELEPSERAVRDAAAGLGADPDAAVAPLDPSPSGRAAHRVAVTLGSLGEQIDSRLGRRP